MNTLAINRKLNVLLSVSLIALSFASTSVTHAGLYRWVDSSGKVHFSDKIPPSISQKGHSEFNKDGLVKKKVLSADALRQIKDEAEKKAEENKQLALNEEKAKLANKEKRKHDLYLLSTFDSKNELIHYYENKISTLSETSNILITRNEDLSRKVKKVAKKKTAAKTKSLQLSFAQKLARVKKNILRYKKALSDNKQEIKNLKKQYKNDLKRYDELSQLTSSS